MDTVYPDIFSFPDDQNPATADYEDVRNPDCDEYAEFLGICGDFTDSPGSTQPGEVGGFTIDVGLLGNTILLGGEPVGVVNDLNPGGGSSGSVSVNLSVNLTLTNPFTQETNFFSFTGRDQPAIFLDGNFNGLPDAFEGLPDTFQGF